MAYKSPLANIFRDEDEEDSGIIKSHSSTSDGYTSPLSNIFESGQTKAEKDAAAKRKTLDALAAKETANAQNNKPWYQKVGDFAKQTVTDFVDRTKDVTDTIGEGIAGVQTQNKSEANRKQLDTSSKKLSDLIAQTENNDKLWDDPAFKQKVAAAKQESAKRQTVARDVSNEYNQNNFKNRDAAKTASEFAETALDVGTLGVGGITRNVVKTAAKQGVKGLAGDVAKSAAIGGTYGAYDTSRTDPNASLGEVVKNAATGAALGGAFEVGGKVIGAAGNAIKNKVVNNKAAQEAAEAAEDELIRNKAKVPTSGTKAPQAAPTQAVDPVTARTNLEASGVKTFAPLDDNTAVKVHDIITQSSAAPVKKGTTRLYQGTEGNLSSDQYFKDPSELANYFNGRGENVNLKYVDVPDSAVQDVAGKPSVFRVSDDVNEDITPFYHGTSSDVTDLKAGSIVGSGEKRNLLYGTEDERLAAEYAKSRSKMLNKPDEGQVKQLYIKGKVLRQGDYDTLDNLTKLPGFKELPARSQNIITNVSRERYGELQPDQLDSHPEITKFFSDNGISAVELSHPHYEGFDSPKQLIATDPRHVLTKEDIDKASADVDVSGNPVPANPIGTAVEQVATPDGATPVTPGMGESRYTSKTIPDSEFVGDEVSDKVSASYQKTTNAQRADAALQQLDTEGVDDFATKINGRLDKQTVTDQTVFDAQAAAQALEKRGTEADLQKAAEIYSKVATHLSKAGQVIQAAAIMARQTPQGLRYYAQKQFEKAGVEFTPKLQKELNTLIDEVKATKPKTDEAALARDNVQYFIAQNIPSSVQDRVINFWRAGLLTGPQTLGGAVVGNTAQLVQRNIAVNPIATMADWTMGFFTGKRTQTLGKIGEQAKGAKTGLDVSTSKQYWKTGYNPLDASDGAKFEKNRQVNYGKTALGQATGKYVNGVYQLMGAADQPFRQAAQRQSLSSIALAEVKNQKLKGQEAKSFYDDFMANPPPEAADRAAKEATRETFANDTALFKAVQGAKNKLRADGHNNAAAFIDYLVPFARVPSAVVSRLIDQTPIGTAREIVKQVVNVRNGGKFDQRAMSRAIGEGTLAVPILAAGYALAQNGEITGGYPATKEERDQWTEQGKQPNSIKIGDRWYSMNYIQPFGTIMALGAGIKDAQDSGADTGGIISQALASGGKAFINQSFLSGISSGLDAVNNPTEFAQRYVANTASGIIPNFIRAGARAADPLQRETEGFMAGIASGIPGVREGLPAKLDADNNPIAAKDNFVNQYLNPLKPSQVRDTPDSEFYNKAVLPASKLKANRQAEINDLLSSGRVATAQRKVEEYNTQVSKLISPYVESNRDNLTEDQVTRIHKLFLGDITVNKKGRPTISSTDIDNGL